MVLEARIPSLSSFLPTAKPGELSLDDEPRDALVALGGVGVGEHDEQSGLRAVGDPELARPSAPSRLAPLRTGCQSKGIAAAARLREREGTEKDAREPREISGLLLGIAPAEEGVGDAGCYGRRRRWRPRRRPARIPRWPGPKEDTAAGSPVLLRAPRCPSARLEEAGNQVGPEQRRLRPFPGHAGFTSVSANSRTASGTSFLLRTGSSAQERRCGGPAWWRAPSRLGRQVEESTA